MDCPMSFVSENRVICPESPSCPWWCGDDEGECAVKAVAFLLNALVNTIEDWGEDEGEGEEEPGLRVLPTEEGEGEE